MPKFKIRKGDTVEVISGKYKGKRGEVLEVRPKDSLVVVAGVNVRKRHKKANPQAQGRAGQPQILEFDAPLHISNVALVDTKTGEAGRVGMREENGVLVRFVKPKREKKY